MNKSGDSDREMLPMKRSAKDRKVCCDSKNAPERKLKSTKHTCVPGGKRDVLCNEVVSVGLIGESKTA